ncbi:anthranilate phosphoribosyltransferase [Paenibacillus turpanensis]|uniref:anthranilate phosphoribosyltransferase n=1 Tax=Paenibacillus turpanensis TaxID=2689078 RepID=UPI0014080261|nr:anthranilate phosphoribosyltransferase [Paenibacillus turpanensis]
MATKTLTQQAINAIVEGSDLERDMSRQVMTEIMDGVATPAQIGSLLTALRMKGETIDEITGFAEAMRLKAPRVQTVRDDLLDTCGTGGDGAGTFNISTASAIVAAAGGIRVAKHGNRAMSSRSGSADVLEALGVNVGLGPEQAAHCLEKLGLCFMFAQVYHQSMKHAAGPRRELGIRTAFNLLGPLTNPAGADRQLMGVFDQKKTELVAHVMRELGVRRAMVVASDDGMDEISISAPTVVTELKEGAIRTYKLTPDDLGLRQYPVEEIAGGDAEDNAEIIRAVLQGERNACREVVLANAGACFFVTGAAGTLQQGVKLAAEAIDSGNAMRKLEDLIQLTGEMAHVS